MKRILRATCALALMLVAMLIFASCQKTQEQILLGMDDADRADEISRLVDEAMEAKSSYKVVMVGRMETMLENKRMVEDYKTVISYLNADTDDFVYQEKTESTGTYGSERIENITVNGYQDGYMYIYSENDGAKAFKSPISSQDYKAHQKSLNSSTIAEINQSCCQNITAVKNSDGAWVITYSSFNEESMNKLLKDMGSPELYFDENYVITDISLSFVADSEFNLKSIDMSFGFKKASDNDSTSQLSADEDPFMPVFTANYQVEYGSNLSVDEEIDLSSTRYKETEDLRGFDIVEKELNEIKRHEDASAKLIIKQNTSLLGQSSTYNETDHILYKIKNGKVEYDIRATTDDDYYRISYLLGNQEVFDKDGNSDGAEKKSRVEALVFLEGLLDQAGFDFDKIRKIEKLSDGEYKFTISPDIDAYERIADTYNGSVSSSTAYLTIKMKDGKISAYIYDLTVKIYIPIVSSTMTITQTSECTYTY